MKFSAAKYVVQSGDTLTSIADKFDLQSWRVIAGYAANASLFNLRTSPNDLQVGDELFIPPNPAKILDFQLNQLVKLKQDTVKMYDDLIREMTVEYQKTKQAASNVDLAAALTQLGFGYAKIVKSGVNTMSLTGQKLAKANAELAKSVMTTGNKFVLEQTIQHSSWLNITGEEGLMIAIPKILLKSWFDMTSPSYWAQRFTGVNLEREHSNTIRTLSEQKRQALQKLDKKIEEVRNSLLKLKNS